MDRESLLKNLYDFDEEAYLSFSESGRRLSVLIVGGSSLVLSGHAKRATHDIDALSVSEKLAPLLQKYDINTSVNAYLDAFPYGFEERLELLPLQGRIIDFFTVSLEDLVVSKLYAMRPSDVEDITNPNVLASLNWSILERLIYDKDEAPASALNERRYREMVGQYEAYREEYGPCAD
jgi:hypothetical protein